MAEVGDKYKVIREIEGVNFSIDGRHTFLPGAEIGEILTVSDDFSKSSYTPPKDILCLINEDGDVVCEIGSVNFKECAEKVEEE